MKKVLVVDDEFDISEALSTILKSEGYGVDVCTNGKEALSYLQHQPRPNLVVMDVMMPYLSGFEVLRFIRSTKPLAQVPVILMSAAPPASGQNPQSWDDFLRKPFNLDSLLELVARHCGKPL